MPTSIKLTKLDKRHSGWGLFTHRFALASIEFIAMREWFWEQYGPGCERGLVNLRNLAGNQTKWGWYCDPETNAKYIYIGDNAVLTHFQLKWM